MSDADALLLREALGDWVRSGAWQVWVLITSKAGRLSIIRREGVSRAWMELVPAQRLDRASAEVLRTLGFGRDGDRFHCELGADVPEPAALATRVGAALRQLGGAGPEVTLCEQHEQPAGNPDLVRAMRRAASSQQTDIRQQLYAGLVNADLLVPIDPSTSGRPADEQQPLVIESQAAGPVFVCFTDWQALCEWSPAGHHHAAVHGVRFFEHTVAEGAFSVRVNPDGPVGGELYRNELTMMVEAVKHYLHKTLN